MDEHETRSHIVGDDAHIVPNPYGRIAEKYIRNVPETEKYVIMPAQIHGILWLDKDPERCLEPTLRVPHSASQV